MCVGEPTVDFSRAFVASMEFAVVCTSLARAANLSIWPIAASEARTGEAIARRPTMVLSLNCILSDL